MALCFVRRWRKRDGDPVQFDEPLVDVEADGSPLVVKSQFSGILSICAPTGKRVSAGQVLATIEPIDGEAIYDVVLPDLRVGPIGRVTSKLKRVFGRA